MDWELSETWWEGGEGCVLYPMGSPSGVVGVLVVAAAVAAGAVVGDLT